MTRYPVKEDRAKMRHLRIWLRRLKSQLHGAGPLHKACLAATLLAVVGGAAWLVLASGPSPMAAVFTEPLDAQQLADAQGALARHAISCRVESGQLRTAPEQLQAARDLLAAEGLAPAASLPSPTAAEQPGAPDDIWCTQAQSEKRWQAAKMATLSKLIAKFPPIRSATVLLEVSSPHGLGSPQAQAAAAVQVDLRPGQSMDDRLAGAIADLVCGSVVGLKSTDVRIVDSTGQSYRPGAADGQEIQQVRSAEAYFADKIRSALSQIDRLNVTVQVEAVKNGPPRCTKAWVSVPQSYFQSIAKSADGGSDAADKDIQAVTAEEIEKVRQAAMNAIAAADPAQVKVDWHYDIRPASAAATTQAAQAGDSPAARSFSPWPAATRWQTAAAAGGAGLLLATAGMMLTRRLRRGGNKTDEAAGSAPGESANPLSVLQLASAQDLVSFLQTEHPQTIAVVLSQLSCEKAAAILAGLGQEMQVEVSRRLAALERLDAQVQHEVQRALVERLNEFVASRGPRAGGLARLADVLRRAGGDTESHVLQRLAQEEPDLAQSLQMRMFDFEDIARMPAGRLSAALEGISREELAIALRTAGKELTQKIFSCLSTAAAKQLRAEMEKIGPVRLSEVESAQQRVVASVLQADNGQYQPAQGGEVLA